MGRSILRDVTRALIALVIGFALLVPPSGMTAARPEAALDMFKGPWEALGYEIVFMPPRAGYRAMTIPEKHRIEVYARPQDDVELLAYDIAHELGHAVDVTYNTVETRKEWMKLRGINPATPWFGCNRCSDYNTPAGDFAETFALVVRGSQSSKFYRGRIAPRPTAKQIRALADFFPAELLPSELAD